GPRRTPAHRRHVHRVAGRQAGPPLDGGALGVMASRPDLGPGVALAAAPVALGAGGRPDVSVVSSGHDVADARLHREVAAARAAGLTVEVLALGSAADGPAGAALSVRPRPRGVARRLALALVQPWRARGRVLLTLDPDVVPAALLAARLRRRRLVVDVHEDYPALLRDRAWARGLTWRLARGAVRGVLAAARRADLV